MIDKELKRLAGVLAPLQVPKMPLADTPRVRRPRNPIGPPFSDEHLGLYKRPYALLEEEWIPVGSRDQCPLERLKGRILAEHCIEQFFGTLGSQRIDPQLDIVGLPTPGVLVLGPVVDEEQDSIRREALHQTIQKCLGLGIDPVQILEE